MRTREGTRPGGYAPAAATAPPLSPLPLPRQLPARRTAPVPPPPLRLPHHNIAKRIG